jgi:predicted enzyme related to lactoylglutathione lyase
MKRVTGIGGIFLKAKDPQAMYAWYEKHLGLKQLPDAQAVIFNWRDAHSGDEAQTIWSLFPHGSNYFDPSTSPVMINYRVADMDAVIAALEAEGITILGREDYDYGRFAWIVDPEGNKVELWQPPKKS